MSSGGERAGQSGGEPFDLAVDDDRVDAFLAPEVLVDDGLGHGRASRDLLDARPLEALLREERTAHVQQLLTACFGCHARAGDAFAVEGHGSIMPDAIARERLVHLKILAE